GAGAGCAPGARGLGGVGGPASRRGAITSSGACGGPSPARSIAPSPPPATTRPPAPGRRCGGDRPPSGLYQWVCRCGPREAPGMKSFDVCQCGAPLQLREQPTPEPVGTEVLLRVIAAGVCHSDLHFWEGVYDLGGGKKLKLTDRGMSLPLTMGHETVGQVVALGPDARGVAIGDRRLAYPWIGCGTCKVCQRGDEQLCLKPRFLGVFRPGGSSDPRVVPHPRSLIAFGDIPPEQAAPLACSGVTAYGALRKLGGLVQSEPIVIIGAGGVGLMSLCILKSLGGRGAIVVDVDEAKREAALRAVLMRATHA